MKYIAIIIINLTLSACYAAPEYNGKKLIPGPKPLFLTNLPQGNDPYSIGFRDGCYHFIGQSGFGLMRLYDRPVRNNEFAEENFITNKLYQQGYRQGDRYCVTYVNKGIIL